MKKKIKYSPRGKYATGGDISNQGLGALALVNSLLGAANYQFDPNASAPKAGLNSVTKGASAGMSFGPVGILAGAGIGLGADLLKQHQDKKQQASYAASATPGNYQQGGPIQPTPVSSRGSRPSHYVPSLGYTPTQQVQTLNSILVPGLMPSQPINPLSTIMVPNMGGTSKSKSKDRFRERANGGTLGYQNGGPIKPNYQILGNIKFDSNKGRQNPDGSFIVKDEITGKDFGVLRNEDGSYKFLRTYLGPMSEEQAIKKYGKKVDVKNKTQTAFNFYNLLPDESREGIMGKDSSLDYPELDKKQEVFNTIGQGFSKLQDLMYSRDSLGTMSPEEITYRQGLHQSIKPFSYELKRAAIGLKKAADFAGEDSRDERGTYSAGKEYTDPNLQTQLRKDLLGKYLSIDEYVPKEFKKLSESKYKPSKASDPNTKYYTSESLKDLAVNHPQKGLTEVLADHKISQGKDENGRYISYYDKWDLDPPFAETVTGVSLDKYNTPPEVYDRIYEKDLKGKNFDELYKTLLKNSRKSTRESAGVDGYASGGQMGDQQLSNTSFQVKGNPNVTDGNSYPELNANLDHNEVVKMDPGQAPFVFSRKLKMENGKSFAEAARKLEISTGRSEKVLKTNPDDPFARATIAHNENRSNILAQAQEELATARGLRGPSRNFATGGPMDPLPNQPYMALGQDYYYDPYNNRFLKRGLLGSYTETAVPNNSNLKGDLQSPYFSREGDFVNVNLPKTYPSFNQGPNRLSVADHLAKYPQTYVDNNSLEYQQNSLADQYASVGQRPAAVPSTTAARTTSGERVIPETATPNQLPGQYDQDLYELMKLSANAGNLPISRGEFDAGPADASVVTSPVISTAPPRALPNIASALNFGKTTSDTAQTYPNTNQAFTIGDGLQALEVGSKFAQTVGGPEKEKPYYDNTSITKENFDPSNALYQSQRNFQLGQNTLQNSSINQNRSFLNNLYVGKLNQDSDILSKYNQMNQGSRTQQEQRQADQRRFNIGQTVYTNDINARNRGAYKNALDTAFTSLGNLGEGLNQKKQGYDVLNILRSTYPEVYARIMQEKQNGK